MRVVKEYPCCGGRAYVMEHGLASHKTCPKCGTDWMVIGVSVASDTESHSWEWSRMSRTTACLTTYLSRLALYRRKQGSRKWGLSLHNVVDFYLLTNMCVNLSAIGAEALKAQVDSQLSELSNAFALMLRDYLYLASMGEARHGMNGKNLGLRIREFTKIGQGREAACCLGLKYHPDDALPTLVNLFRQGEWKGGYGGKSWGDIAAGALMYNTVPNALFIDHAVDLQHNNGTAFNKASAFKHMRIGKPVLPDWFQSFLNYKAETDCLHGSLGFWNPHEAWTLASTSTVMLGQLYYPLYGEKPVRTVDPEGDTFGVYEYESPEWRREALEVF